MKVAPLIAVALVLCIALPGLIQAKKKQKFCVGKDGNRYKEGEGYEDREGEACIYYKCVKKNKKKFVMKSMKCVEDGEWSPWSSWSDCSATCGRATKKRTRTCSNPAPSNGGKPCSGPETETEKCSNPSCGPDMNEKVDSLELNVQSLNDNMQSLNDSMQSLNDNVQSLNDSMQTLQTTMLSVLELMTTIQSTADKQGSCMSDLSSSSCPDSAPGKIGVVDGINSNKAGITSTKADININKDGITSSKADIKTNNDGIRSSKADINANKAGIISAKADINTNKAGITSAKADININKAGITSAKTDININKVGITSAKADINTNKAGINTNKAGVNSNKADINTNKAGINTNEADINTNEADINTNKADINTNEAGINTNMAGINANNAGINTNRAGVNTNKAGINTNKANINTNEAGINTNKADINTNKAGINANIYWTIIQRRGQYGNAKDYFYKDFKDYENGFGSVYGELWIGLKTLAALTSDGEWELQVELTDWDDTKWHAKYGTFSVGPAPTYKLHVGGYDDGESTLGDSMAYSNGWGFSARDKDQDGWSRNCAESYKGGWWYYQCKAANLNGLNYAQQRVSWDCMEWYYGKARGDSNKSWKESVMKIKRITV